MAYAIAQTSGKQFVLEDGRWHDMDLIKGTEAGDLICFHKILFLKKDDQIQFGQPFLSGAKIMAKVLQTLQGKKITVLKTKPKKKYTRTQGHRSEYTRVQVIALN